MTRTFDRSLAAGIAALGLTAGIAQADQVFVDDVIATGSLCVGQDCVNGESFGFDTIRLKENNLRIKFQDTSNSASFPTNDWQLTANDSSNGGANKFSIDDIDGGRTPFTIEASAPSHSLYVDDGGRIGLGTSTPIVDLQVVSGNSPTLRLEQNGSSGFTAQTWDLAGNEANFFVRDVTNGSALPFRIFPDAPQNALTILGSSGDIGIGTATPDSPLHLSRSGAVNARFEDTALGVEWESGLAGNDTFKISAVGTSGVQFRFTREGGMVMQPQAAAPTVSVGDGMLYYDNSGALCARVQGAWVVLSGTGSCV
ncbi:MAG: hypothetical protein ACRBB0_12865 [Pelagimonas sp.]|uniref:hypothetical protein n=1 Tax=Pelagimonas sp. TaxID=2073170 RepID=UPI003D6C5935